MQDASVGQGAYVANATQNTNIPPGGSVIITLTFSPAAVNAGTNGILNLSLRRGTDPSVNALFVLAAPVLVYEFTLDNTTTTYIGGQAIAIGSTPLGQARTGLMNIRNIGSATAQLTAISVVSVDAGFRLPSPPPLPQGVASQQTLAFTVEFVPQDVGVATAQLRVENELFLVSGTGLGSKLSLAVEVGGISTNIAAGATIEFPNTIVGAEQKATVTISNTGNQTLAISNIAASGGNFFTQGLPPLPLQLQPGENVSFFVRFLPDTLGVLTGNLLISGRTYVLRGSGSGVVPLPNVLFGDVPNQVGSAQQPSISMKLEQPYPYNLQGTLVLSFTSDSFVDDPSIQFSSSGRSVTFQIPANTTTVLFGQATKIQFQTGTVAGIITFTPSFSVQKVDITPGSPPTKSVTLLAGPPQLQLVQLGAQTANSFELLITGYASTRQISEIRLEIAPTAGTTTKAQSLVISAGTAFGNWYQTSVSRQFGSQFTASVTLLLAGKLTDIQSVSTTLTNNVGVSSTVVTNLR
ncbi:MAG: choice-of-anchor D domain-containing protein [Acidobacteriota bacterium]